MGLPSAPLLKRNPLKEPYERGPTFLFSSLSFLLEAVLVVAFPQASHLELLTWSLLEVLPNNQRHGQV